MIPMSKSSCKFKNFHETKSFALARCNFTQILFSSIVILLSFHHPTKRFRQIRLYYEYALLESPATTETPCKKTQESCLDFAVYIR